MKILLKKGKHYASPRKIKLHLCKKEFKWEFKLSKDCWYEPTDVEFAGINKLRGLTFGIHNEDPFGKWKLTKWLVNSVLIGWQPDFNDVNKKRILLYLYYDVNGIETREYFDSVDIEQTFRIKFIIKDDGVHIRFNKNTEYTSYHVPTNTKFRLGYHLYPYFGGKSVAPHDMTIYIV
jgi:hypothetical protein